MRGWLKGEAQSVTKKTSGCVGNRGNAFTDFYFEAIRSNGINDMNYASCISCCQCMQDTDTHGCRMKLLAIA